MIIVTVSSLITFVVGMPTVNYCSLEIFEDSRQNCYPVQVIGISYLTPRAAQRRDVQSDIAV